MPELLDFAYVALKTYYLNMGMSEDFARFYAEREYLNQFIDYISF